MWFVLGLFVLIGICVGVGVSRSKVRWKGVAGPHGLFRVAPLGKSKKKYLVQTGVAVRTSLAFEIKPETAIDRFAKYLGLSVEAQVGKPDFDNSAYLVSDDPRVVGMLKVRVALLESLQALIEASPHPDYRFHRIVCSDGVLRVDYRSRDGVAAMDLLLRWAGPLLEQAKAQLPPGLPSDAAPRDPFHLRAVFLLAIAGGLAVNGLLELMRLVFSRLPFTIDPWTLWSQAMLVGGAIVVLLVAATVAWLGRTSRAHLVLVEVLLLAAFGAPTTAFTQLRDLNMEADDSPAQLLPASVIGKESQYRRKRGRVYTLKISDWNGTPKVRSVEVSSDRYARFSPGDRLVVRQHAGFLGARWVEGFEHAPASKP